MVKLTVVFFVSILVTVLWTNVCAQERPNKPPNRAQIRKMIKELDGLSDADRKARIQELYEKYGKPLLKRLTKAKYQPGTTDENTQVFEFKKVPKRNLKIYIDFPPDWKKTDNVQRLCFGMGAGLRRAMQGSFIIRPSISTNGGWSLRDRSIAFVIWTAQCHTVQWKMASVRCDGLRHEPMSLALIRIG